MGLKMDVSRTKIDAVHLSLLVTSLKSSQKLKEFSLRLQVFDKDPPSLSPLDSLIDMSSFESVCSSNSPIQHLKNWSDQCGVASWWRWLRLHWRHTNWSTWHHSAFSATINIKNKKLAIQKKVGLFYMQGSFDVTSFTTMNIWLIPKVMNLVDRDQTI